MCLSVHKTTNKSLSCGINGCKTNENWKLITSTEKLLDKKDESRDNGEKLFLVLLLSEGSVYLLDQYIQMISCALLLINKIYESSIPPLSHILLLLSLRYYVVTE